MIHSIWMINKAGGLIYQRTLSNDSFHPKLSANDQLILASTFQSCHAISAKVSPVAGCTGIETLELHGAGGAVFGVHCLQSPTGVKILVTTDQQQADTRAILKKVLETYVDYALKNPFYKPEMPIRSELFEAQVTRLVKN